MMSADQAAGKSEPAAALFERLLADTFARLLLAPHEEFDGVRPGSLAKVSDFLGGERAAIFLLSPDGTKLVVTHRWAAEGISSAYEAGAQVPVFPLAWLLEGLSGGNPVAINDIGQLPPEAREYREFLRNISLRAVVNVPLRAREKLIGIFGFGTETGTREWPPLLLERLRLVGQVFSDVLLRKRVEEDLREAERRFRIAAESVTDMVFEFDLASGVVESFGELTGTLGYEEEGVGETGIEQTVARWEERLHPDDRRWALQALKSTIETGVAVTGDQELRIRTKQGNYRTWTVRCTPVTGEDGAVRKLIGAVRDKTKECSIARDLTLWQERFRFAAQLAYDVVWEADIETGTVEIIGDIEACSGYTREEFPFALEAGAAQWWEEHVHIEDREEVALKFRECLVGGRSVSMEFRLKARDGSYRHWREHLRTVLDHDDRVRKIIGAISDVTAMTEAKKALDYSESLYHAILDSIPAEVVVLDERGIILSVNPAWERFAMENGLAGMRSCGPGADYLAACRNLNDKNEEEREMAGKAERGIRSVLDGTANEFTMEYPCHQPGERRWFMLHAVPLRGQTRGAVVSHTNVTKLKESELDLIRACAEIKSLKERLEQENLYLREHADARFEHHDIVGQSEGIKRVLREVEQVALTNSSVLIHGETGTGKELIAHAIHNLSARREHAMVKVNCGALPAGLIESELFGREKGAFTGATKREQGRFELAHNSTIFLDEVGELPPELQAKLLRVLQNGEFERLGSGKTIQVDSRVVAASNRDLAKEVESGNFREDLYYRLNVFPITVPPLRERPEDVPLLVRAFIKELSETTGKTFKAISSSDLDALKHYPWPGNVRELRNVIERAMILCDSDVLRIEAPKLKRGRKVGSMTLAEMERGYIEEILGRCDWRIRGDGGAAQILDLNEATLRSRMKKLGIKRPAPSA